MLKALRYAGQAVAYALTAAILGYFSVAPTYEHFPPGEAQVTISFAHSAKPKGECRRLSAEELAALPANMRQPLSCPRERLPVFVELEIDNEVLLAESLPPTGIAGDGAARIYRKFTVPPGEHSIVARLRDSDRTEGFDYVREAEIDLAPQETFVVDFKADLGGFLFF